MTKKARILVVDDEDTLCEALRFNLEAEGYSTDVAHSAEEALTLDLSAYDLILLDIMMEHISGTHLARILKQRQSTASIPIIFCTAKDSEDDMIDGLSLGADDYITKPYSIRNVIARIKTVLRRTAPASRKETEDRPDSLSYKTLIVDPVKKTCTIDNTEIKLPRKEFEILTLLMRNPGQIFSRDQLITTIWPEKTVVLDRVVDVNITRLRSKLGEYSRNIVTRSGYGYVFVE